MIFHNTVKNNVNLQGLKHLKMKLLYYFIGSIVLLILAAFFISPLFLPEKTQVVVHETIKGPKELVYNNFNNLKKQVDNNSFLRKDSTLSKIFLSPYVGKNANFKWNSFDDKIGSGDILITSSTEDSITTLVTFNQNRNAYEESFIFEEKEPNLTEITWKRNGQPVAYFERYLLLLNKNEDEAEIKHSLANLKDEIESQDFQAHNAPEIGKFRKEKFEGMKLAVVENEVDIDDRKIGNAAQTSFKSLDKFLKQKKDFSKNEISKPIVFVSKWDTLDKISKLDFGYSIGNSLGQRPDNIQLRAIPPSEVYTYTIDGDLSDIDSLKYSLELFTKKANRRASNYFWIEELASNPDKKSKILKGYLALSN